ncbi:hypothetical protein [Caballeronia cordobensis]|uniref:hypothetical protein n=1 Tax=Caballeronia cordobensis TaxID=1353886 RepID=UPI001F334171|nr:hypothetical protein [Caballeronia cordobensis]
MRVFELIRAHARVREKLVDRNAFRRQFRSERGETEKTLRRRVEIRMQRRDYFRRAHVFSLR